LARAASSGLERATWAREHGIDGRSLQAWHLNLRRRSAEPRFVELVPRIPVEPTRYVLRLGDLSLELDDGFEETTLRRLLSVLASC